MMYCEEKVMHLFHPSYDEQSFMLLIIFHVMTFSQCKIVCRYPIMLSKNRSSSSYKSYEETIKTTLLNYSTERFVYKINLPWDIVIICLGYFRFRPNINIFNKSNCEFKFIVILFKIVKYIISILTISSYFMTIGSLDE